MDRIFTVAPIDVQLLIASKVCKDPKDRHNFKLVSKHCHQLVARIATHVTVTRSLRPNLFEEQLKLRPQLMSVTFDLRTCLPLLTPLTKFVGTKLKKLCILHPSHSYGTPLRRTDFLAQYTRLTTLKIEVGYNGMIFENIAHLTTLTRLDLCDFSSREKERETSLKKLSQLTHLTDLGLNAFTELREIQTAIAFTHLKSLSISRAEQLTNVTPIKKMTKLTSLQLYKLKRVVNVTIPPLLTRLTLCLPGLTTPIDLSPLKHLLHLGLKEHLEKYEGVAALTQLQSLKVPHYPPWLLPNSLKKLSIFVLTNAQLKAIAGRLLHLKQLNIGSNEKLTIFAPLSQCTALQELWVRMTAHYPERTDIDAEMYKHRHRSLKDLLYKVQSKITVRYTGGVPPDQLKALKLALPDLTAHIYYTPKERREANKRFSW